MFCEHCGAKNADNAKFCKNCGNSLAEDNKPQTIEVPKEDFDAPTEILEPIQEVSVQPEIMVEAPVEASVQPEIMVEAPVEASVQPEIMVEAPIEASVQPEMAETPIEPIQPEMVAEAPAETFEAPVQPETEQPEFIVESVEPKKRPQKKKPQKGEDEEAPKEQKKTNYSPYPVVNGIKKAATAGTTLTANILYTIAMVLTPVFTFLLFLYIPDALNRIEEALSTEAFEVTTWTEGILILVLIGGALILLPQFFYTIGKWLVFISGKNRRKASMGASGFVLIKIATVIRTIFNCIFFGGVTLLCLFLTIVEYISLATASHSFVDISDLAIVLGIELDSIPLVLLIMTAVFALIFIFNLIYNVKKLSTCTALADMGRTGRKSTEEISMFLIIMLFVVGVIYCALGILSLLALCPILLILGVSYFLHALSLIKARTETKRALLTQQNNMTYEGY